MNNKLLEQIELLEKYKEAYEIILERIKDILKEELDKQYGK